MIPNTAICRGKTKDGQWIIGSAMCYSNGSIAQIWDEGTTNNYLVDPNTLCQFVGLYDENGQRIFTGDIVTYGDAKYKVVFEDRNGCAYFGIVISDIETWAFNHLVTTTKMKVVGNIFDDVEEVKVS